MASRIKKDDTVEVVTGANKGKRGKVLRIIPARDKVVVEGVNVVKRHVRPTPRNPQGGILEVERPIHISNVMPVNPKTGKPTRVRYATEGGKRVRKSIDGDTL